jgi:hypothetical protein
MASEDRDEREDGVFLKVRMTYDLSDKIMSELRRRNIPANCITIELYDLVREHLAKMLEPQSKLVLGKAIEEALSQSKIKHIVL